MSPAEVAVALVVSLVVGGLIGALARLLVPGTKRFGVLATIVVGAVAAFFGGVLGHAMGWGSLGTFAAQVLVAVVGVLLFRKPVPRG